MGLHHGYNKLELAMMWSSDYDRIHSRHVDPMSRGLAAFILQERLHATHTTANIFHSIEIYIC